MFVLQLLPGQLVVLRMTNQTISPLIMKHGELLSPLHGGTYATAPNPVAHFYLQIPFSVQLWIKSFVRAHFWQGFYGEENWRFRELRWLSHSLNSRQMLCLMILNADLLTLGCCYEPVDNLKFPAFNLWWFPLQHPSIHYIPSFIWLFKF